MEITMLPVASTNIGAIGYDEASQTLAIRFHSGGTYAYDGVMPDVWQRFQAAESKGKFFHQHIKPTYQGRTLGQLDGHARAAAALTSGVSYKLVVPDRPAVE